jgi:mycoredoxin-dependent peroxiredoxin
MAVSIKQKIKNIFKKEKRMALRAGHFAPDFELETHLDTKVRLGSFRGKKNVVIAFFPLAFTPI